MEAGPAGLPLTNGAGAYPRYRALAQAIKADISTGKYAVGDRLPTEEQLMQIFGVSRHTVRQALQELKDSRTIIAMRGIGTVVHDRPQKPRFSCGINSLEDLLQFVDATEMRVLSTKTVIVDEALAAQLHCTVGRQWFKADIVRVTRDNLAPLSYLEAFVPTEYAGVLRGVSVLHQSIYSRLEEFYSVSIVEVHQSIAAARLSSAVAQAICAEPGEPALCITRYYLNVKGEVVQIGVGYFPGDRYTQDSKFRMQME